MILHKEIIQDCDNHLGLNIFLLGNIEFFSKVSVSLAYCLPLHISKTHIKALVEKYR